MDLGKDVAAISEAITLKSVNQAALTGNQAANAKIQATLSLDEDTKIIPANKDEVRGRIYGSITEDLSQKVDGLYREYTTLTATVK